MGSVQSYLDNLVDENGLKTEIIITLPDRTLWRTGALIVGSVMLAAIGYFAVRAIANRPSTSIPTT